MTRTFPHHDSVSAHVCGTVHAEIIIQPLAFPSTAAQQGHTKSPLVITLNVHEGSFNGQHENTRNNVNLLRNIITTSPNPSAGLPAPPGRILLYESCICIKSV